MKTLTLTLTVLSALAATFGPTSASAQPAAPAAAATQPASKPAMTDKAAVRAAIDRFLAHPQQGEDATAIVLFAQHSPDVEIALDENVTTWVTHQPAYPQGQVLLTAFIAGNVRSQLDSGQNRDDSYAGLQAVFKVYDGLLSADKTVVIPEVVQLRKLDESGQLKAKLDEIAKARH